MKRFCETMANVCLTLGLTLLVGSVFLVPANQVLADDGTGGVGNPVPGCAGDTACSNACTGRGGTSCGLQQDGCTASTDPQNDCSTCKCKPNTNETSCHCKSS